MKITNKYCQEIYDRHVGDLPEIPEGSESFGTDMIRLILEKANKDSRFHVNWDPGNYGQEDDDTWDVIGPACPYGYVFLMCREDAESMRDILNRILRDHFGPKKSDVKYTPEAHRARTLLDGLCCPSCGDSESIETGEHYFSGPTCNLYRACVACGSEWMESYVFHEYKKLKND